ncbi:DUF6146 family protein [Flavobacterium terrae]|uniref:Lipoprotein n=1 Tax=Flavobacterium terrae TaxID=415425 RepID=A0A1M6F043_9FLAO|nr:DUF6146 family protein [Flavobacterium terrae]SHI91025.1 hypothetical protein SAMN05444363_2059 [Flavobacterium terrae]
MKQFMLFLLVFGTIISCKTKSISNPSSISNSVKGDTVTIANKDLEYEVTIIDPGFTSWLNSRAFQRGYHSESYLENKNQWYVSEWNRRVLQPQRYDPSLYEMQINYDPSIHYGYEVNYLIYNYMIYFQNKYKQKLLSIVPPR